MRGCEFILFFQLWFRSTFFIWPDLFAMKWNFKVHRQGTQRKPKEKYEDFCENSPENL